MITFSCEEPQAGRKEALIYARDRLLSKEVGQQPHRLEVGPVGKTNEVLIWPVDYHGCFPLALER